MTNTAGCGLFVLAEKVNGWVALALVVFATWAPIRVADGSDLPSCVLHFGGHFTKELVGKRSRGWTAVSDPPAEYHAPMVRRRLPIGIQTFREIREEGCYYVDKTPFIRRLLDGGKHYFLSRPRRFGKSLFLDTLKELFEGSEPLFEGLAIHGDRDWSVRHPVVRLSFGSGHFTEPGGLRTEVADRLRTLEDAAAIVTRHESAPARFRHLLEALHERTGRRVVVLVDEYDKPILDALEAPEVARANRDYLRGLYAVVKDSDAHIRFSFLTGVSKFSNLFELKVVEMAGEGAAMAQLKARGYAEKYRSRGEPIHLIGVEFSREARNVVAFEVERA